MNIYDIAKAAGVSTATVSRVINGSEKVKPATAEHVQQVMEQLSFTPNVFARSLQLNTMKTIAVLTVDISDVYFAVAVQAIEEYARNHGYDVQVSFATAEKGEQAARLASLLEKRVDGLILAGSAFVQEDNPHIRAFAKKAPVAILNGRVDGPSIYSVLSDDARGIELVVDHLVERGRRRLLYLQDSTNAAAQAKRRGLEAAMARHDLPVTVLETAPGIDGATEAWVSGSIDPTAFDGVICAEDPLAVGTIKYLHAIGRSVPDDVAVTGYDNLSFARASTPEITSVDAKVLRMSTTVVEILISAIEGNQPDPVVMLTPKLVTRESSRGA